MKIPLAGGIQDDLGPVEGQIARHLGHGMIGADHYPYLANPGDLVDGEIVPPQRLVEGVRHEDLAVPKHDLAQRRDGKGRVVGTLYARALLDDRPRADPCAELLRFGAEVVAGRTRDGLCQASPVGRVEAADDGLGKDEEVHHRVYAEDGVEVPLDLRLLAGLAGLEIQIVEIGGQLHHRHVEETRHSISS